MSLHGFGKRLHRARTGGIQHALRLFTVLLVLCGMVGGEAVAQGLALTSPVAPASADAQASAQAPCADDARVTFRRTATKPQPGEEMTFTVTVAGVGGAEAKGASFSDDLSGALDDAEYVDASVKASAGTVKYNRPNISWTGDVSADKPVTVTYKVKVDTQAEGDGRPVPVFGKTSAGTCVKQAQPNAPNAPDESKKPAETKSAEPTKEAAEAEKSAEPTKTAPDQESKKAEDERTAPAPSSSSSASSSSAAPSSSAPAVPESADATPQQRAARAAALPCDDELYSQVGDDPSNIWKYNPRTQALVKIDKTFDDYEGYDALAYSKLTNKLYAVESMEYPVAMLEFDPTGAVPVKRIPLSPVASRGFDYRALATTPDGSQLALSGTPGYASYLINIDPAKGPVGQVDKTVLFAPTPRFYDWAYNPVDGFPYAIDYYGKLSRFNFDKGTVETSTGKVITDQPFHYAQFFDSAGMLYSIDNKNPQVIRQIDLSSSTAAAPIPVTPMKDVIAKPIAFAPKDANLGDLGGCLRALDFGDAPSSYGTDSGDNAAAHPVKAGLALGAGTTVEPAARRKFNTAETAVEELNGHSDLDDATPSLSPITQGAKTYETTVMVTNTTGSEATVAGWIDLNADGKFDAGERATTKVAAGATQATLEWKDLPAFADGITYARLRLFEGDETDPKPDGLSVKAGEVEDYALALRPVATCKSRAYGTVGTSTTQTYHFDPALGRMQLIPNTKPASGGYDGVGFSQLTGNIYGVKFNNQTTLAEIDPVRGTVKDYPLSKNLPSGGTFNAGATSPDGRSLYTWSNMGTPLYVINLDPARAPIGTVIDEFTFTGSAGVPWDFAVHPKDGFLYGVGVNYKLVRMNLETHEATESAQSIIPGSIGTDEPFFGAFFDDAGNLYVTDDSAPSKVVQIDLTKSVKAKPVDLNSVPVALRVGTVESGLKVSDLAGCVEAYDFGDAPLEYGTALADGGPRHKPVDGFGLGMELSSETDAHRPFKSDGTTANPTGLSDTHDDGIEVLPELTRGDTGLEADVRITNKAKLGGTLAGWFDADNNKRFDDGERVTAKVAAGATVGKLTWTGLAPLTLGTTFLRVRLYSGDVDDAKPVGEAEGGEVEDYAITVALPNACTREVFVSIGGAPSELARFEPTYGKTAKIPGTTYAGGYDGIGYSRLTGHVYGMRANHTSILVEIDPVEGKVTEHTLSTPLASVPFGTFESNRYDQGTVSADGSTLIVQTTYGRPTYMINIDPARGDVGKVIDSFRFNSYPSQWVWDWAAHPLDGRLYGGGDNGNLNMFDLTTKVGSESIAKGLIAAGGKAPFHGAFFDRLGNLYVSDSSNPVKVFRYDLTKSTQAKPLGVNDFPPPVQVGSLPAGVSVGDAAGCLQVADFGDAPASFGAKAEDGGPSHRTRTGFTLGAGASSEADAIPKFGADGAVLPFDATTDTFDDGVTDPSFPAESPEWEVEVKTTDYLLRGGTVAGWFDKNKNGTFDTDERVTADLKPGATSVKLKFTGIPPMAEGDKSFLRLRMYEEKTADPLPRTVNGKGGDGGVGEVEDHVVTVTRKSLPRPAQPCVPTAFTTLGKGPTDLATFDPAKGKPVKLPNTTAVGYDGIGYSVRTGHVYGVATKDDVKRNKTLIEVDPAGKVTEHPLSKPLEGDYLYDVGAANSDGSQLLVFSGWGRPAYAINIDADKGVVGQVLSEKVMENHGSGVPFDWAVSPLDGQLYSVGAEGKVVRFDIAAGTSETATAALLPALAYRGVFFDSLGNLYAVSGPNPQRVMQVDLRATTVDKPVDLNEVTFTEQVGAVTDVQDAAACLEVKSFGDSPESYGTKDAWHKPVPGLQLGARLGVSTAPVPEFDEAGSPGKQEAIGSKADDALPGVPLVDLNADSFKQIVALKNDSDTPATLAGWIDFNKNGTFETGERATVPVPAHAEGAELTWPIAAAQTRSLRADTPEQSFQRLRLFSGTVDDAQATGPTDGGEVEDYPVQLRSLPPGAPLRDQCDNVAYQVEAPSVSGVRKSTLYTVNLSTRTHAKVNETAPATDPYIAMAYSSNDGKLYGVRMSETADRLVTIDKTTGAVSNAGTTAALPPGNYYPADTSVDGKKFYTIAKGSSDLQIVGLDPADTATYMKSTSIRLTSRPGNAEDFSVHPQDGRLWGFNEGKLFAIDMATKTTESIAIPGTDGLTYAASTWFDSLGNLYLANTNGFGGGKGRFYQVDLTKMAGGKAVRPASASLLGDSLAEDYADGAGCLKASDYGDAPATYGTPLTLHSIDPELHLGADIDAERGPGPDNELTGRRDDITNRDDEDAVTDMPVLRAGLPKFEVTVPVTKASADEAKVGGWVDFNADGDFDDAGESAVADVAAGATSAKLTWPTPAVDPTKAGSATYARLRLYSGTAPGYDPQPTGPAPGFGEMEDYPITIREAVPPGAGAGAQACSDKLWMTWGSGTGATPLYTFAPYTSTSTRVGSGTPSERVAGNLAYNPFDGLLYSVDASKTMRIIDPATGTEVNAVPVPGITEAQNWASGAISPDGKRLYLYDLGVDTKLRAIDLDPTSADKGKLVASLPLTNGGAATTYSFSDFAVNPADGMLYGIESGTSANKGKLLRINPADGAVTELGSPTPASPAVPVMAWFDSHGTFYSGESSVSKAVWMIDLSASAPTAPIAATDVPKGILVGLTNIASGNSDGAGCIIARDYSDSSVGGNASHFADDKLRIGKVGSESGPVKVPDYNGTLTGTGDPSDDSVLPPLHSTDDTYTVKVKVTNGTGVPAKLLGWLDSNANGTYDAGEKSAVLPVAAGESEPEVTWSGLAGDLGAQQGKAITARFRLFDGATPDADLKVAGDSPLIGEVEDYPLPIRPPVEEICNSEAYLSLNADGTSVVTYKPSTGVVTPLNPSPPGGLVAFGQSAVDGHLYGLRGKAPYHTKLVEYDPVRKTTTEHELTGAAADLLLNQSDKPYGLGATSPDGSKLYVFSYFSKPLSAIGIDKSKSDFGRVTTVSNTVQVPSGAGNVWDFAYHPTDGFVYGVGSNGQLIRFTMTPAPVLATTLSSSPVIPLAELIGNTGEFSAVAFDTAGNLYAFDSKSKKAFQIDLSASTAAAPADLNTVAPAQRLGPPLGTSSPIADGGGCLRAADYGDAPDTYKTSDTADGPTAKRLAGLSLGAGESVETDARQGSGGLDGTGDTMDDGIAVVKPLSTTANSYKTDVTVNNTTGREVTLAGWLDPTGTSATGFDPAKRVVVRVPATPGTQTIPLKFDGLSGHQAGRNAFLRLRLYDADATKLTDADVLPSGDFNGGGEIEDYPVPVVEPVIKLTKTADKADAKPGETVVYTVKVKNTGAIAAPATTVTDDLTDTLKGADFQSATGGAALGTGPTANVLTWTGDLPANGESTFTYTVKVKDYAAVSALSADDATLVNTVASEGSDCAPGATAANCTATVKLAWLEVEKKFVNPPPVIGANADYTVTVKNVGPGKYLAPVVDDDMTGVLDDGALEGTPTTDPAATGTFDTATANHLKWTAPEIAAGATVTLKYAVKVTGASAQKKLENVVVVPDSNCNDAASADPKCNPSKDPNVPSGIGGFAMKKSMDPVDPKPGQPVKYTITLTNDGTTDFATGQFEDDLSGVLDDLESVPATLPVTKSTPAMADADYTAGKITWSGPVPPGAHTFTYTVTLPNKLKGDKKLINKLSSTVPTAGCPNPAAATPAPNCGTGGPGQPGGGGGGPDGGSGGVPELDIKKAMSPAAPKPGDTVEYTVTLKNDGTADYTGAEFSDDLVGILDDADQQKLEGDATATPTSAGAPVLTGTVLKWTGTVPKGDKVEVKYSIKLPAVANPAPADGKLKNAVVSTSPGSNCTGAPTDDPAVCGDKEGANSGIPQVAMTKVVDNSAPKPGEVVTYTVTMTNTGGAPGAGDVNDNLTDVVDDADITNGDVTVSDGSAFTLKSDNPDASLKWSGTVPAQTGTTPGTVVITYKVTVPSASKGANDKLGNAVTSTIPGNPCAAPSPAATCSTGTGPGQGGIPRLKLEKKPSPENPKPGDKVTYTVTLSNAGTADYSNAEFSDDLLKVIDDGTFNNDAKATLDGAALTGTEVPTQTPNSVSWKGTVPKGKSVVVTYSVQLPLTPQAGGDGKLVNKVVSPSQGSNCPGTPTDPAECGAGDNGTGIAGLKIEKAVDKPTAKAGDEVTYTVTLTNTGTSPYENASFEDNLAEVLKNATWTDFVTPNGAVWTEADKKVTWSGTVPASGTMVFSYKVKVDHTLLQASGADPQLKNTVTSAAPGAVCAACETTTTLQRVKIVKKAANTAPVKPGDDVPYTITVENTGTADLTGFVVTDDLTDVLGEATFKEATPAATPAAGKLEWTLPTLAKGATEELKYTVTVKETGRVDNKMTNTVSTAPGSGSNCDGDAATPSADCKAELGLPALTIKKTSTETANTNLKAGDLVTYKILLTNTGEADYPAAAISDSLADVIDDAEVDAASLKTVDKSDDSPVTPGAAINGDKLTFSGTVKPGHPVEISYQVKVKPFAAGTSPDLVNMVEATPETKGTNCPAGTDPAAVGADCRVNVKLAALTIKKVADKATTVPGDTVTYTVTITHSGKGDYNNAVITDDLAQVLDKGTLVEYSAGVLVKSEGGLVGGGTASADVPGKKIVWTGTVHYNDPAVVAKFEYKVKVNADASGQLVNTIQSASNSTNCAPGALDEANCKTVTPLAQLDIEKKADPAAPYKPGQEVKYTVTVKNSGTAPYAGFSLKDSLAGVLDDAELVTDSVKVTSDGTEITDDAKKAKVTGTDLEWTGDVPADDKPVVVSYSVKIPEQPKGGNTTLDNVVVSENGGSNCKTGSTDAKCKTSGGFPQSKVEKVQVPSTDPIRPGSVVEYKVTLTNTGSVPDTAGNFKDDLSKVLDDADWQDADLKTTPDTAGAATFTSPTLEWNGTVPAATSATAPGTVVITYKVKVKNPPNPAGDGSLVNKLTSLMPGSKCKDGANPQPAECGTGGPDPTNPTAPPAGGFPVVDIKKTQDPATAVPGGPVKYTVTLTNTGRGAEPAGNFEDNLTDVIDDADFDEASLKGKSGTTDLAGAEAPKHVGDKVTWNGVVPPKTDAGDGVVVITYTVKVPVPLKAQGNGSLANAVTSTIPGNPCTVATNRGCSTGGPDPVTGLPTGGFPKVDLKKTQDKPDPRPGDTVEYTVTLTNSGAGKQTGGTFEDDLTEVLKDADVVGTPVASAGEAKLEGGNKITWKGDIPAKTPGGADGVVTVTYKVTIPETPKPTATGELKNSVTSPIPGNPCTVATNPGCSTGGAGGGGYPIVKFEKKQLTADPRPGKTLVYEVTLTNTGSAPESAATFTDKLEKLLDDTEDPTDLKVNGAAEAEKAKLKFDPTAKTIVWNGVVPAKAADGTPGKTVVSYSLKIPTPPKAGDGLLVNSVISPIKGSPCKTGEEAGCSTGGGTDPTTGLPTGGFPIVKLEKKQEPAKPRPGDTVKYTVTLTNTGAGAEPGGNFEDNLEKVLDDTGDPVNLKVDGADVVAPAKLEFDAGKITWEGTVPPKTASGPGVVTVTYEVVIPDPPKTTGDGKLVNAVTSTIPGNPCDPTTGQPLGDTCTTGGGAGGGFPIVDMEKTSDKTNPVPGDTVQYTVTFTNTGAGEEDTATFNDALKDVLDDAEWQNDVKVDGAEPAAGTVVFNPSPDAANLLWQGTIPAKTATGPGKVVVTYSVKIPSPPRDAGNGLLLNTVTSPVKGNPCQPPASGQPLPPKCVAPKPDPANPNAGGFPKVKLKKTQEPAEPQPGDKVTYTVTLTNSGAGEGDGDVNDDLSAVLDDATWEAADLKITGGTAPATPVFDPTGKTLKWTGKVPPKANDVDGTVVITYAVKIPEDGGSGDGKLTNAVTSSIPGNPCKAGQNPMPKDCGTGQVDPNNPDAGGFPKVKSEKKQDPANPKPGQDVTYTVTLTNTGSGAKKDAEVTDDLAQVLDDATFKDGSLAVSGEGPGSEQPKFEGGKVTWKGTVPGGGTTAAPKIVTITYTVTIPAPPNDTGDGRLTNSMSTNVKGDPCISTANPRPAKCQTGVVDPANPNAGGFPKVKTEKTVDNADPRPGDKVTYTVTLTNTGLGEEDAAKISDDLTEVLDDADFQAAEFKVDGQTDPKAKLADKLLTWEGKVPPKTDSGPGKVVITYAVVIPVADKGGNGKLGNVVKTNIAGDPCSLTTPPVACIAPKPDPRHPEANTGGFPKLSIDKKVSKTVVTPGEEIIYTVVLTNKGAGAEPNASFEDDLTDVLKDADVVGTPTASAGTASVTGNKLTWSGPVAAKADGKDGEVSVTYTVKVPDPVKPGGDTELINKVIVPSEATSPMRGVECNDKPNCTKTVAYPRLKLEKKYEPAEPNPGDEVKYTVTMENTGKAPFTGASFSDDISKVVDDAEGHKLVDGKAVTDLDGTAGEITPADNKLSWTDDIPAGKKLTVTYSIKIPADGGDGDGKLVNQLVSDNAGSECKTGSTDPKCGNGNGGSGPAGGGGFPKLTVQKIATPLVAVPGDAVRYTVKLTNPGGRVNPDVKFSDDLTDALMDGDYGDDAKATAGRGSGTAVSAPVFTSPKLTWSGALGAGEEVDITYTVKLSNPLKPIDPAKVSDRILDNTAVVTGFGSKCADAATAAPECKAKVKIADPAFKKVMEVLDEKGVPYGPDKNTPYAGDNVRYTVTMLNSGSTTFTNAEFTDDLSRVLDDATWNDDLKITGPGNPALPVRAGDKLTWKGDIQPGSTPITVTYSLKVNRPTSPPTGDGILANSLTSPNPGSNCVAGAETEACSTGPKPGEEGTGGIPQFRVQIVDDQAIALPDETVNYTATIKNTGKVPYKDARAMIDLSDILDDASWVGNLKTDSGTVGGPVNVAEFLKNAAPRPRSLPAQGPRGRAYTPETGGDGPILWWTGDLAVGGQAVITYTVKVDNPPKGNMRLLSQIMGQAPSTNCENNPEAKKSPECATDVLIPLLKLDKKLDAPANPKPGDKVTYTVTLSNAGTGDFEKAWFSDDLSGVLDDAKLDEGSIKATGGKVTYSKPKLRWDGTVPAKGTVTVTYSLTVVGDRSGDGKLVNGLVSDLPGSNCRTGSTADVCKGGPAAAGGVKITQQAAPEKSSPKSPAQQAVTAPWPKSVPKKPWITPSTGAMIGITAGVGLLAALAGGFLLVLARRNRRRDAE